MQNACDFLEVGRRWPLSLAACVLQLSLLASPARGADHANLAVAKPVMVCEQLVKADIRTPAGEKVTIGTANIRETEKGPYCRVTGTVNPGIGFAGDLPTEKWTQRFLQGAQGREGIERAGTCMPALNGE
jgi:hypothetical protein